MRAALQTAFILLVLLPGGCKSAKEEARKFTRCSRQDPCRKPNVCLRQSAGGTAGVCVHPCATHADCPSPFRCSGRFQLRGTRGRFCRRASVKVGQDCSRLQDGCLEGLRCFKNRCRRRCKKDEECTNRLERCLKVVDDGTPAGPKPSLFRACLVADRKQGDACGPHGPFCRRGHVCQSGKCLRVCASDKDCGGKQICDGSLYIGPKAKARAARNDRPDVLYCRVAGRLNAYCNLRLDRSCRRGLYCLGSRCRRIHRAAVGKTCREMQGVFCQKGAVCFAGRCRRTCDKGRRCPRLRGRRLRCEERTVHGKKTRICL